MAIHRTIAKSASLSVRVLTYTFLRWILLPFFAPAVFTSFAIYTASFLYGYFTESRYEVVHDEIDLVVTDTTVKDDTPDAAADGDEEVVAEEVEVQETIVVGEKPIRPWETLLLGVPNPRSLLLSLATFLINAACVGMVADRLYREHSYTAEDLSFVRLGYVSDTEAKLLVREPDQSKMPVTVELHIKDPQPPFDNPLWQTAGGIRWTTNETDFTTVLSVPLRHNKQRTYEWKSSNGHSGEFTSPPKAGQVPEIHDGQFTFLATSCIVNRLPYSPFDHPLSIPGMRYLAKVLPDLGAQFMLFLGDFIYADVPRYWGKGVQDYRQKYRQVYASPEWTTVGQNLSWIHILDDHEIANDWDSNKTGVYKAAVDPWKIYQVDANPPPARKAGALSARPDATYFQFSQGPASFFLLDTRSYRSKNVLPFNSTEKTMLGAEQLEDFLDFLRKPEPKGVKWKIVASSVPFTKNWRVNTKDTWGGFLAERQKILEAMWDVSERGIGVIILSGDRHEFAATKFPPPADSRWPESAAVYEFSASPLSQFYVPIGSYKQTDDEDVKLKYINKGNSKFGAVTIENLAEGDQSSLKYRLFVDGVETWNTVVLSPPKTVESKAAGGLGGFWDRLTGR
ncbi:Alkaline phosphatase D [Pleurostoma richardsiae]|uniref:Alkaline phosphatase D n=1 Tax=Pleurostoma richardsiae TaxID=41990 RepID=A0AA38RV26_9PEZI|nr:Alkaline phosphatase D [Pleurostoma richardsiae]